MWHIHNSASSGGEVGDVWGRCLVDLGTRIVSGCLIMLIRGSVY